jgi:hypothetical protein
MYTLVKVIAKTRGRTGSWFESSETDVPVRQIASLYTKCYLVLTNPYYEGELTLDCDDVAERFAQQSNTTTITQWLAGLGQASLPVTEKSLKLKVEYVKYKDAIQAGWKMDLCHRTAHPSVQMPKSEKDDVRMYKEGVTAQRFLDYCLVTVNNLVHLAIRGVDEEIQVIDAGISNRLYNDNHLGILSFEKVGKLKVVPITEEMIAGMSGQSNLSDLCVIKVPSEYNVEQMFPMISVGGFLHSLGSIFSYLGNNCFKVDLGNFGWESRYFELLKRMDLSTLHAHMTRKNGTYVQVANEELFSDDVLKALLTLSNSFIVLVDNPDVMVSQRPVERTRTPGVYLTQSPAGLPVLYKKGMLYDTWEITEMDRCVIKGKENLRPTYNHETTSLFTENSFDDTQYSSEPDRYSMAFQWLIGAAVFD